MKKTVIFALLSISVFSFAMPSQSLHIPDSLLTIDNIYNYTFSDYDKSLQIAKTMRQRKMSPAHQLDIAEGDLYFNNGKCHQAIKFYTRALESDSVKANNEASMKLMHRFISCYDVLQNEPKKVEYIEMLLKKAQAAGNSVMESIAQFNMGKTLYYQKDKERGYRLINEAIRLMENSDYEYKKDNLVYDYNTLYIMQQLDNDFEGALQTLDKLHEVITGVTDEEYNMEGINKKELKTMYANRAFALSKLNRKQEAAEAYNKWKEAGNINSKDNYLIVPYLMNTGQYDEVIRMSKVHEDAMHQNGDSINYHMRSLKRIAGRAYAKKGDYKKSSDYFYELAVLNDSIKHREQRSAALELATVYETMEKEAEIQKKNTDLRLRNLLLVSALLIILLLAIILGRNIYYARTIRRKNQVMAQTINQLMEYKEEKRGSKESLLSIASQPELSGLSSLSNESLFDKLDHMVISHKLYLDRNLTREDLMKLIGVEKNRFGQILKQGNQTSITGYINNLRLEFAVKLLRENPEIPVSEVAEKCALPNISTFYRIFKDKYGMTPVEFRAANKNSL